MTDDIKVPSLKKSIDVLNCFIEEPKLGVTQISKRLGLSKSHVFKILATYESMGYIDKDKENGKYELGIGIFTLSRALGEKFIITKVAAPYMQDLANKTNERVYLAIPYDGQVLYLEAFYPIGKIGLLRNILGEKAEMYCTGIGKAMLSALPQKELEQYCEKTSFIQYTDRTIVTKEALIEEIKKTQRRGFAVDDMEHEFGIRCVAMPVFDRYRHQIAAISVSGSSILINQERMTVIAQQLKLTVQEIESRI